MSFSWRPNGTWKYDSNEKDDELAIGVPMPGNTLLEIEHLSVDTSRETLGVWSCPSGSASTALSEMQSKAQKLIDRAKEGSMMRRDIWFLLDHQLWPKLDYGLCSNTASFEALSLHEKAVVATLATGRCYLFIQKADTSDISTRFLRPWVPTYRCGVLHRPDQQASHAFWLSI